MVPAGLYGLTLEGKAICLSDYGADLAEALSTRVVLIQDRDHKQTIPVEQILNPNRSYRESRYLSNKGIGRFCAYYSAPICISSQMKTVIKDIESHKKPIFMTPLNFRNSKFEQETVVDLEEFGNVFFDLRNIRIRKLEMKRNCCFKEDLGLWNYDNQI